MAQAERGDQEILQGRRRRTTIALELRSSGGNRMQDSGMGKKDIQNDLRWYTGSPEFVGRVGRCGHPVTAARSPGSTLADTCVILSNGAACAKNSRPSSEVGRPSLQVTIGEYDARAGRFELTAHDIASPSRESAESRFFPYGSRATGKQHILVRCEEAGQDVQRPVVNVKNHQYRKGRCKGSCISTSGNRIWQELWQRQRKLRWRGQTWRSKDLAGTQRYAAVGAGIAGSGGSRMSQDSGMGEEG